VRVLNRNCQKFYGLSIGAGPKGVGAIVERLFPLGLSLARPQPRLQENYEDKPTALTPAMTYKNCLKLPGIRRRSRECSDEQLDFG
jgi:hypothetical protein